MTPQQTAAAHVRHDLAAEHPGPKTWWPQHPPGVVACYGGEGTVRCFRPKNHPGDSHLSPPRGYAPRTDLEASE